MSSARGTTRSRRYRVMKKAFREKCASENARCWICGHSIDYRIPYKDPVTGFVNQDAFQLDHLYPRSTHPEMAEDPANFRPSHGSCNNKRSNKLSMTGIGQTTRSWIR